MTTKAVAISARIPQEDAVFISQLKINDAKTPSDKLRAIIAEARRRQENQQDYRGCMTMIQDMITPVGARARELELEQGRHSELVSRVLEWLPDTMAFIMAAGGVMEGEQTGQQLNTLENGIADRVFRLMESVLQMGVTQRCPCYDVQAIQARVEPVLDLMRVISITREPAEETHR